MGDTGKFDMLMGTLYVSAAVLLLVVSYLLYLKRLKRGKMVAKSEIKLTTSRYDTYTNNTQFLLELSDPMEVKLELLDAQENYVLTILNESLGGGEQIVDFKMEDLAEGIYYISLKTDNHSILRKITVKK
jgi:hypothetical protein